MNGLDSPLDTSEIHAWALRRMSDMDRREFAHSLQVGPQKPMGSYGFDASFRGVWAMWKELRARRGPGIGFWTRRRPVGDQIWIYAWHQPTLRDLLAQKVLALDAAGWPHEPAAFVQQVSTTPVAPLTPLYDLIADAHGDRYNPGRTDVLPQISREALFASFLDLHGTPDPAFVYWRVAGLPLPEGYP